MSDPIYEEEVLGRAYDLRLLRRLWHYISPYRSQVLLTLAMVLPLFLLDLAPGWIVKTGLDRLVPGQESQPGANAVGGIFDPPGSLSLVVWLAALYLVATVSGALMQFLHMLLMANTGQSAMRDLRGDVFRHMQKLHLGFFDRYPVGRLVTRATNDVENVAEMFSAGIVALVTDVLKMIGFAVALFLVNAKLASVTFLVVPFLAVAAILFRLKVREAFRKVRVRIARINAHIQESIGGMKVVQLFAREARNMRDFDAMNADHRDAWKQSIRYDSLLFASVEAAQGVTIAIIIWYGTGLAEPGVLYIFIDWMRRFFMPLRDLSAKYSVMQSSMASSERIFQLLDTEPAIRDADAATQSSGVPRPVAGEAGNGRGAVVFENVWFAYQGEDWVLRDVSFSVAAGDKVAFVGATGAGKSTLINLLTRLYEVSRGRITIDGIDIRDLPQRELRRRVVPVLQDVFLFTGSISDNIALGREGVGQADVERASMAVEAHAFVERLPAGYATEVRERGNNFSAGQRQLLSFARALAHGSDILVLDEATSAIDTETEALIQRGIHVLMEGRTAIVIAHRLSTIQDVDRIYVLKQGRIVESGSHEELLANAGAYQQLYRLQYQLREPADPARASVA